MRKVSVILLLLVAFLLAGFAPRLMRVPACSEPISYYVGSFDERFNISRSELVSALKSAEEIWEGPSDRNLFAYSVEDGDLPINLIYDYRQETTEELTQIEEELEDTEATYELLEARYKRLEAEYESLKDSYESAVSQFEEKKSAYEARVDAWNKGPRNNKKEFNDLERERQAINVEVDRLNSFESELNQKVEELNTLAERMNRLAKTLNLNVEEYNAVGASRGETYEGGVYFEEGRKRGINIYEFSSREKLVRLLAHELGHALGLEHIDDPKAIMYFQNKSESSAATDADLAALRTLCENAE